MKNSNPLIIMAMATTLCGCHSANLPEATAQETIEVAPTENGGAYALPKAVVYKMNGDYAQYVPVTVNAEGTALVSYPAPSDLNESSTPVAVADGYYLDRRGVGGNTRFTRWTYAEYRALKQVPTPQEIMSNLIPDARVVDVHRLPITAGEAMNDIGKVNQLIKELK